jgi:hypothetical protein
LKNSAQQFYHRPTENDAYLIAGYPWFKVRARDLFVSLPGCTLSIDDPVRFEKIMTTAIPAIRNYMKDCSGDKVIKEIEMPDVFLWAIWAMQQYSKSQGIAQCEEKYGELIQDIIDYIKILTLGDHATYMVMAPKEITEEERRAAMAEMQARIDAGEITIKVSSSSENQEEEWLTFTDAEEGKNQFYANVMLPTELPGGFAFKHIFYFVKSLEGLQEDGANKYMGVVYSDGTNEIRMQIRHMDETTGFESVADADTGIRALKINGHEAIIADSTLDVLIDDTMYMFFGRGLIGETELVKMAQSLR